MNRRILDPDTFRWLFTAVLLAWIASSSYWVTGLVQFSRGPAADPSVLVMPSR